MFDYKRYKSLGLENIYQKVLDAERLDYEDGLKLFNCPDLMAVGALAAHKKFSLHGSKTFYVVNRQINYTNICVNGCLFCAFRRDAITDPQAFLLDHETIINKIANAGKLDELHIVGGCHPELPLSWFEELLRKIHNIYPDLLIKAFTPVEIAHFAKQGGISTRETLSRLQQNGLAMLPGGGAEIFAQELRQKLCPHKATGSEWLRISGEAHELGIKTNCTMLFGHWETYEDRVDHLLKLRGQQDKSGGFTCFIPLPFLKKNSRLQLDGQTRKFDDAFDKLLTIAVSRLLLDNIPHIKSYWIMLGTKLAQTALHYGADDLDGTIIEEKIGHMAGASSSQAVSIDELDWMIRESGFEPVRRNAIFETLNSD